MCLPHYLRCSKSVLINAVNKLLHVCFFFCSALILFLYQRSRIVSISFLHLNQTFSLWVLFPGFFISPFDFDMCCHMTLFIQWEAWFQSEKQTNVKNPTCSEKLWFHFFFCHFVDLGKTCCFFLCIYDEILTSCSNKNLQWSFYC